MYFTKVDPQLKFGVHVTFWQRRLHLRVMFTLFDYIAECAISVMISESQAETLITLNTFQ